MRITCPSCQSTYQLADGTLGATGRKVRCTRCGTVWHARPGGADERPALAPAAAEAAGRFPEPSDDEWRAALAAEDGSPSAEGEAPAAGAAVIPFRPRDGETEDEGMEPAAAAAADPVIDAEPKGFEPEKRPRRASRPERKPLRRSPRAGTRPNATLLVGGAAGFVLLVLVGAFAAREEVVRLFPAFAGLYEAVGLTVNLRGLDFSDVKTFREMDGSTPVLVVEGSIANATEDVRPVPSLRFALLSGLGREVYAWTMEAPKDKLAGGETMRFKSRLPAPPDAAVDVEVRFTDRRGP